jgi:uncharacterized membrane protein
MRPRLVLAQGRKRMKKETIKGATLAIAAVSIALAGAAPAAKAETTAARVHCLGVNSCKGKSDCHTPKNACKGNNSCKGQGWLYKESAQACTDAGGKVLD